MASFSTVSIRFSADLKAFSTSMQNAQRSMKKMGKQMTDVGKNMSIGITAPIVALGYKSVEAFDKQAKAIAQVEAGLKSTGAAAGFTSNELQKMASDLQNKTIFGDEEILQGATAQLLTFTNIAGTQFERTQEAALNLATRLDGDLKSASIQLGKALNDPIANLSALSRSGIQFSEDQKAVIKALTESGKLADAQTIILDELEKQYGGAAEAAAKAGTGGITQLKNILGDLTEEIGQIINEGLKPMIARIKEWALKFRDLEASTKKQIVIVGAFAAAIGPVLISLGFLMTTVIPGLVTAFGVLKAAMVATPWGAVAAAVGLVAGALVMWNTKNKDVVNSQTALQEVNKKAIASIAEEKAKVEELLWIARDENVSKQQRIKAIEQLNKISPKYFGNLDLETINTDKARLAVEKYNDELIKSAKVKAAQAKLQEIQAKIIDKELELSTRRKAVLEQEKNLYEGIKDNAQASALAEDQLMKAKQLLNIETENGTKALEAQAAELLKLINLNKIAATSTGGVSNMTGAGGMAAVGSVSSLVPEGIIKNPLDGLSTELPEKADLIKTTYSDLKDNMIDVSEQLNTALEAGFGSAAAHFGTFLGSLATGQAKAADFFSGLLGVVASFMENLGQALIAVGVASEAFKKAFTSGFGAIAAGAALIALSKVVQTIFAKGPSGGGGGQKVTPFANGGLVYTPTLGLMGEYSGARSNPEVIAPLDKLKGYLKDAVGDGGDSAKGEFKLRGQDLILALDRAGAYKKRRG